jgi:hypothetical protein
MRLGTILLFSVLATSPSTQPGRNSVQSDPAATKQGEPSVVVVNNATSAPQANHGESKPKRDLAVWANWALVGVGILTLIAVAYQAKKTAEATEAMRDSATETRHSVAKMDEANRISRENMQAGQRAYVSFPVLDMQMLGYEDANTGQLVRWDFGPQ